MKKKNWIYLLLIALSMALFIGYRVLDRISTDMTAPEITVDTQQLQVSVSDPKTALLQGVSAKDDRDGSVTDSLVVESVRLADHSGRATVTYAAFDQSGNVAKVQREFQYTDYQRPRFSLSAPLVFSENSGYEVLDYITVEDAVDGDISHRIRASVQGEQSVYTVGIHDIQLNVTNSLGDSVELVVPVEIYTSATYEAALTLTDYLIYLPVGASFDPEDYLDEFSFGRESISLGNGVGRNMSLRTTGSVDTAVPGVYAVTYKLTYKESEDIDQSFTGYSKLIVVVEG